LTPDFCDDFRKVVPFAALTFGIRVLNSGDVFADVSPKGHGFKVLTPPGSHRAS